MQFNSCTNCSYAVSYTHLDVYKRQAMACVKDLTKIDEALMQVENIILPMIKE